MLFLKRERKERRNRSQRRAANAYMPTIHRYYLGILHLLLFLFWAMLGLCCCMGVSLVVASGGYSLVVVGGLLIAVVSLVAEHRLWSTGSKLWPMGLFAA